ncbi:hypothetical protein EC957_009503 [Mortierella hygrophila]|uniref:F-box domain-containing protein n=1 Tax=Mortierella hygrophila TaxID=979708 RepID=A0A9P6EWI8_9FUNG|nr:hypothetical protein EC957_009503 [Mortierella hygrophila]
MADQQLPIFPPEIIRMIIDHLPIAALANTSTVNRAWLEHVRAHPIWTAMCQNGGYDRTDPLVPNAMTAVCLRSGYICGRCSSVTKGRPLPSDMPLATAIQGGPTLALCRRCRTNDMGHNFRFRGEVVSYVNGTITVSERQDDVNRGLVAIMTLIPIYAITKSDLVTAGVNPVATEPYLHAVIPIELFSRMEVQDVATRIHGGWNGIDAARNPKREWDRRQSYCERLLAIQQASE